ncbi:MAG: CRISPR system precrRNA processing endoribonuclease RAMP protein Cas6 [Candidatus Obscuribacterales bacterium]|nr:CRISPR system precrRNA processing endoribonuclease RAMP protein Cas6 [Candidatus Obscuribacterales bacterium]
MQLWLYEFTIQALNTIDFAGFNGSALRGGFGDVLRKLTCHTGLPDCSKCPSFRDCPFTRIFNIAPPEDDEHFKSETQVPRPFIIEAMKEQSLTHGQQAKFRVGLVGKANDDLPYFVLSFQQLGKLGIGRGRGNFKLVSVTSIDPLGKHLPVCLYDAAVNMLCPRKAVPVNLEDVCENTQNGKITGVRMIFDSPTLLNRKGEAPQEAPQFEHIIRGILRRYSDLAALYGEGRPKLEYKELVEDSKRVEMTKSNIHYKFSRSYSKRKEAITPLQGITGSVDFRGEITPFMPYLIFGQWLHIGKQATFGMGQYHLEVLN